MGLLAMAWAWRQENLDPTEKLVLLALADHHNESTGMCCPSVETLAKRTNVSGRSVQRTISLLETRGLIERRPRYNELGRQRSNNFVLMAGEGDVHVTHPPDAGVTHNRKEGNREEANASSRKRDELWDALVAELGDVSTKTERGERNGAVKELREAGATADEIHLRCRAYRRRWPEITLTASALKKHWTSLSAKPPREPQPIEVALSLPEISDEERQQNAARISALASAIGKDAT